jgi:cell division protein FtsL
MNNVEDITKLDPEQVYDKAKKLGYNESQSGQTDWDKLSKSDQDRLGLAGGWLINNTGFEPEEVEQMLRMDNPERVFDLAKQNGYNPDEEIINTGGDVLNKAYNYLVGRGYNSDAVENMTDEQLLETAKSHGWKMGSSGPDEAAEDLNMPTGDSERIDKYMKPEGGLLPGIENVPERSWHDLSEDEKDLLERASSWLYDNDESWKTPKRAGELNDLSYNHPDKLIQMAKDAGYVETPTGEEGENIINKLEEQMTPRTPLTSHQANEAIRQDLINTKGIQIAMREAAEKPPLKGEFPSSFDELSDKDQKQALHEAAIQHLIKKSGVPHKTLEEWDDEFKEGSEQDKVLDLAKKMGFNPDSKSAKEMMFRINRHFVGEEVPPKKEKR